MYNWPSDNINTNSTTDDIEWSYGNTLLKQEFNEFGFYQDGKNIKIEADVPESLKNRIRQFESSATSYLLPCTVNKFTGIQTTNNQLERPDGVARPVYDKDQIVYRR